MSPEYAAGFFDGEGAVGISPSDRYLRADISNTNREILEMFRERWSGSITVCKPQKPQHKPVYHWRVKCGNAEVFLRDVLPFLVIKKERVEFALEIRAMGGRRTGPVPGEGLLQHEQDFRARQLEMIERLREMNRRGVPLAA